MAPSVWGWEKAHFRSSLSESPMNDLRPFPDEASGGESTSKLMDVEEDCSTGVASSSVWGWGCASSCQRINGWGVGHQTIFHRCTAVCTSSQASPDYKLLIAGEKSIKLNVCYLLSSPHMQICLAQVCCRKSEVYTLLILSAGTEEAKNRPVRVMTASWVECGGGSLYIYWYHFRLKDS